MARNIDDLGNRRIPDLSGLVGVTGYLQAYNQTYAELAKGLHQALEILRGKFNITFPNGYYLGSLRLKFVSGERAEETFKYEVPEGYRYYPKELEEIPNVYHTPNVVLPSNQLDNLVADFAVLQRELLYKRSRDADDKKPAVRVIHNIIMNEGIPEEGLGLEYQKDGTLIKVVDTLLKIDISAMDENSPIYRINQILATYARTPSAKHIRIPFNRLAIIDGAIDYLVNEIEENEKRVIAEREALPRFRSAERVTQQGLPGLLQ